MVDSLRNEHVSNRRCFLALVMAGVLSGCGSLAVPTATPAPAGMLEVLISEISTEGPLRPTPTPSTAPLPIEPTATTYIYTKANFRVTVVRPEAPRLVVADVTTKDGRATFRLPAGPYSVSLP